MPVGYFFQTLTILKKILFIWDMTSPSCLPDGLRCAAGPSAPVVGLIRGEPDPVGHPGGRHEPAVHWIEVLGHELVVGGGTLEPVKSFFKIFHFTS